MFAAALALALTNFRLILIAGAGALAMYAVWWVADVFDDRAVARAARADYVKISELEAERARARTAEQLLAAAQKRAAEIEADKAVFAEAFSSATAQIAIAQQAREELQDEIDHMLATRPDGVPTVADLGVRLRN